MAKRSGSVRGFGYVDRLAGSDLCFLKPSVLSSRWLINLESLSERRQRGSSLCSTSTRRYVCFSLSSTILLRTVWLISTLFFKQPNEWRISHTQKVTRSSQVRHVSVFFIQSFLPQLTHHSFLRHSVNLLAGCFVIGCSFFT